MATNRCRKACWRMGRWTSLTTSPTCSMPAAFMPMPVIYGAWFGVPTARQPCKSQEVAEIHIDPGQQRSWSFFVWVADNRCILFRYPGIDTEFSLLRHRRPLGNRRS